MQRKAGTNAVQLYTVEIFQDTGDSTISPKTATVILGVVYVVSNLVSVFVIDSLGRKTLIVSLNLVMAISQAGLGTYFYLKEKGDGSENRVLWLPSVSMYAYAAAYCCGIGSVPWVLGVELYNPDYSAESAILMTTSYWTFGFVVAITFEDLKHAFKVSGTFWFYASFCLGGAIFTAVVIPETKGKSSEEIRRHFGGLDSRVGGRFSIITISSPDKMAVSEASVSPFPKYNTEETPHLELESSFVDKKAEEDPLFELSKEG